MKIKLLIITILLLFASLSSELVALDIPMSSEVQLVVEEDSAEEEIEKQDFILENSFQLPLLDLILIQPSTPFLDNYLCKDNIYKPPIP
jgi:hypothetical protein